MKTNSLGFIGGGRITKIFLQAFVNRKAIFDSIAVFDTDHETRNDIKLQYPFIQLVEQVEEIVPNDFIFLAIPVDSIFDVLQKIKASLGGHTVLISLAPRVTIAQMGEIVPVRQLVRLVPNATSIINQGYNPICFPSEMSEIQKWQILEMLNLLGHTFETSEEKLEGYGLLSAMLPTYFWFQWHELENIGTQFGLSQAECREAIYETLTASLNTMYRSGMCPNEVMDLIPKKPIVENEELIKEIYRKKLNEMYQNIKP